MDGFIAYYAFQLALIDAPGSLAGRRFSDCEIGLVAAVDNAPDRAGDAFRTARPRRQDGGGGKACLKYVVQREPVRAVDTIPRRNVGNSVP